MLLLWKHCGIHKTGKYVRALGGTSYGPWLGEESTSIGLRSMLPERADVRVVTLSMSSSSSLCCSSDSLPRPGWERS